MPALHPLAAAALAVLVVPGAASAQELAWSDGALGSQIDYHLTADAGEVWLLALSANEGPTPLSLVDPLDPRLLFVGLDLIQLWPSGVVPPEGELDTSFPLPPDATVVGQKLHSQFVTISGRSATLVDDISNTVVFRLQLPGTSVPTVGKRPAPGVGHAQTALANGRILLTGGVDATTGEVMNVDETYWPQGQVFVQGLGATLAPRTDHTASLLADGRVLLAGGRGSPGALDGCVLLDPATDVATPTGALASPRSRHTATVLPDGRVLAVGGLAVDDPDDAVGTLLSALPGTEVYDPASGAWSPGPSLPTGLIGHTATALADGRVLVAGGIELASLFGFPTQTWTDAAWLIDVGAGTVTPAAPLPVAVARHAAIRPAGDDRPVVLGGETIEPFFQPTYVADVHRYDPAQDAWTALPPLNRPRGFHAVTEADGRLVVAGGVAALDAALQLETPELSAEVAPADLSTWGTPIPLLAPRNRARATAHDDGLRVLVTGGPTDGFPDPTAEIVMP